MSATNLDTALNVARVAKGLEWRDVARLIGRSPQTIYNIRKGRPGKVETDTALERLFGWPPGRIAALREGTYPPLKRSEVNAALTATIRDRLNAQLDALDPERLAKAAALVELLFNTNE